VGKGLGGPLVLFVWGERGLSKSSEKGDSKHNNEEGVTWALCILLRPSENGIKTSGKKTLHCDLGIGGGRMGGKVQINTTIVAHFFVFGQRVWDTKKKKKKKPKNMARN